MKNKSKESEMSENKKEECNMQNETLKLICKIEKNYKKNFEAQAENI